MRVPMGRLVSKLSLLAALLLVAPLGASLSSPGPAVSDEGWRADILDLAGITLDVTYAEPEHLPAPTASTGIGPGSRIFITMDGDQYMCTANFVWETATDRYLGTAGHCVLPPGFTATHGPGADWSAADSIVDVCVSGCTFGGQSGFLFEGTLVRLGAATYGRANEGGATLGNDFGLIRIPPSLYGQLRTSMPMWGGPTAGQEPAAIATGAPVCQYGHGMVVGEVYPTQGKIGTMLEKSPSGRYQVLLGAMPGDSGSPTVLCAPDGNGLHGTSALGIHTHSNVAYTPWKSGTTISKAKAMAARDVGLSIQVIPGV